MIKAFYEVVDRLDRAQNGFVFCMIATVVGLIAVATAFGLGNSGNGGFLPDAFLGNLVSGTLIAAFTVIGVAWLGKTLTTLGILAIAVPASLILQWANWENGAKVVVGVSGLFILFTVTMQLMRRIFDLPWRPLTIAKLVLDEAVRLKIALVFIIAMLVYIPLLATTLDPGEALRYQVQTFLSYGTGLTYGMLAVMTLFLSTATVAFEQRDKTIFGVISKPISRAEYLLGKWIGVMGLNAVLLILVAGSIFWFVQYLRTKPAMDPFDRLAVTEQVLTARVGVMPTLTLDETLITDIARERIRLNPKLKWDEKTFDNEVQIAFNNEVQKVADEMQTEALTIPSGRYKEYTFQNVHPLSNEIMRTVSPGDVVELPSPVKTLFDIKVFSEDGQKEYSLGSHFMPILGTSEENASIEIANTTNVMDEETAGIKAGQRIRIRYFPANALTLRFKINSGDNDPALHFKITIMVLDSNFMEVREVALVQTQTMLIPAGLVNEKGELSIAFANADMAAQMAYPETISLPPDGLELMYKVSDFETNYGRAMLINWLKLGFLAMLGIATATFASFPVACLMSFCIFFGAQSGPFLAESLEYYKVINAQTREVIFTKLVISWIAKGVHFVLQGYGDIRPAERLIEGRYISWTDVWNTFASITLLWTGITAVLGWSIFRSRQLAIYSGHQ